MLSIHNVDEDTDECRLYRLVEPENLTNGQAEGNCIICNRRFVSNDPDARVEAGPGGLRQLPCAFGHAFCLECIRDRMNTIPANREWAIEHELDALNIPDYECPLCFKKWEVHIQKKRDIRARFRLACERYWGRMMAHFMADPYEKEGRQDHALG